MFYKVKNKISKFYENFLFTDITVLFYLQKEKTHESTSYNLSYATNFYFKYKK